MNRMRSVPFILVVALALGAVGCFTPKTQPNMSSGVGSTYDVPLLGQMPVFDGAIAPGEWDNATVVNGTFEIHEGGKADGSYPFTLRVASTRDGLVLAIEVVNKTPNPYDDPNRSLLVPDYVDFFFNTNGKTNLTPPAFDLSIGTWPGSTFTNRDFWNGHEWENDPKDDGLTMKKGQPINGSWGIAKAYNETTSIEAFTPRYPVHSDKDSLNLKSGAEFSMAICYMRQASEYDSDSPNARGDFSWPRDCYPGAGANPFGMYEPSTWLNFRMTN